MKYIKDRERFLLKEDVTDPEGAPKGEGSTETTIDTEAIDENKKPFVYSITPFAIFRPFEVIRNYIDHEKIPVTIIGGGRDQDYGYLGFSHWANDDFLFMENFKNIKCFKPSDNKHLEIAIESILDRNVPAYINLKK